MEGSRVARKGKEGNGLLVEQELGEGSKNEGSGGAGRVLECWGSTRDVLGVQGGWWSEERTLVERFKVAWGSKGVLVELGGEE